MESFVLAETLKYLLLVWDPKARDAIAGSVFTTEGHIFPVRKGPKGEEDGPGRVGTGDDDQRACDQRVCVRALSLSFPASFPPSFLSSLRRPEHPLIPLPFAG